MTNGIVHSLLSHACYLPQILPRHRFHLLFLRQERGQPSFFNNNAARRAPFVISFSTKSIDLS
jgi:hypothetical protein